MPTTLAATPSAAVDVLLVDDDESIRVVLTECLTRAGYTVSVAENGSAALALLADHVFQLVVTDIYMPQTDGLELIMCYRAQSPGAPVLAISGGGQLGGPGDMLKPARFLGSQLTLAKPFELGEFMDAVRHLIGPR